MFVLMFFLTAITSEGVFAAMSSTNYEIRFDQLSSGGEDTSSSSNYQLRDSVGGIATQGSSSTSYSASSGYGAGIFDPSVDFNVYIQDRSSQVAAIALSSSTVTVTSAAGIAVGDMIAVVQDEGVSQVVAIGEVTGVSGANITVDFLSGGSPTIDASNDSVYVLDGTTMSLGTLNASTISTALVAWEANVDTDDGYSVYIYEDGDLSNGSDTISDVTDGTVSEGVSEYGGRSSDTTLASSTFDTADTAFTTSTAQVGSRSGVEFKSRDFLTLKASINATQAAGSYSHSLTLLYVGDY